MNHGTRVQEKQQVKDQQSCISVKQKQKKQKNKNETKLTVKQNLQTCIIGDNKDHNDSK